ncbi:histidine phosphatase family protein [Mycobacteroides saopaulense]|uniref:Histidine phosphatase family protein n=1 Tax=Mycobacteroides saopaulense TaxID=1578165 RepID=A0ABX3C4X7_9MYCO|nr:histidine phosphatase family protein [Mycobacteroides saopaulense]OHT88615.1 histidine phosphatase family protein [Mycobacteroides saopaulense]OHU13434.1 histidine phosphatase family protein [Mycobacteroides saopaulense]
MSRTIVHLMRHGEVFNPEGILYGRLPNFRLSDKGQAQAAKVAESLRVNQITTVVASPLLRAQQTATPIAEAHGLAIVTDEDLIEAGNSFEGMKVSVGDGALRDPRNWWKLRDPFTPSWGEPYRDIASRMTAAIERARERAEGSEAVCVSHQLPVWTARQHLQGNRLWHDPRKRQCNVASLTSLVFDGKRLVDVVYSEPAG